MEDSRVTYIGACDFRSKNERFGIKNFDRSRHLYVIGKTGMGKSTLLENMAIQDIRSGNGLAFMDPHGKTAELLLEYIPEERVDDVIYFAPFDQEYPVSFNVMEDVGYDKRHLVVSGLMSAFEKIWADQWSARMEYILSNTLLALLEYPNSTLLSVNRMFIDNAYRKKVVANVSDPTVKSFWQDEFAKFTERYAAEATPAIQNKIGQFTSNPVIRNIIGQPKSSFDFREAMDAKKIIIINLSKGRIGEVNANLLGSMIITKIYLGAMSRAEVNERELQELPSFYFYVDEFQSFANRSFADILSESRKYKLALTIAHQYIEQMSDEVRAAVFGNVGTMITFQVGATDAEVLEREFAPVFTAEDLVNLGKFQMYLRLMIDGVVSRPFSATSLSPMQLPDFSFKDEVVEASRRNYATERGEVEKLILEFHEDLPTARREQAERAQKESEERKARENSEISDAKTNSSSEKGETRTDSRTKKRDTRNGRRNDGLSLKELKEKEKAKAQKGTQNNMSELRKVLDDLKKNNVGSESESQNQKPAETVTKSVTKDVPREHPRSRSGSTRTKNEVGSEKKPAEIPEDELREMLEVRESQST